MEISVWEHYPPAALNSLKSKIMSKQKIQQYQATRKKDGCTVHGYAFQGSGENPYTYILEPKGEATYKAHLVDAETLIEWHD